MLTLDALQAFGANVDEGMARCLNNEGFYLRLVKMALTDDSFHKLSSAVEAGDLDAAFEAAHALKGVMGNLAITPVYAPAAQMTELLRNRAAADYGAYIREIGKQLDLLKELCGE